MQGAIKKASKKVKEKLTKKKANPSQSQSVAGPSSSERAPPSTSGDTGIGTVWNGVISLLNIAQATLDSVPVPGLKSAIGGFLAVVNQLDVSS